MKWLVRISNSHREVSVKEVESLFQGKILEWINPLQFTIQCSQSVMDQVLERCASVKWVMYQPLIIHKVQDPVQVLQTTELENVDIGLSINSFAARFNQLLGNRVGISKRQIERLAGGKILEILPDLEVNLEKPDSQYRIVLIDTTLVLGWIYQFRPFSVISSRSPKESPFFGGGAMKPMLSKILVNLLADPAPVILDPFCGHGGFLREISSLGRYAVGMEVSWKIARENRINNYYHKEDHIDVITGDALHPPFRQCAISHGVTDPPYAKQSTTIGRNREILVENWLRSTTVTTLVMTLPSDMEINIPQEWNLKYEVYDFVHKSLTRVIRKMERKT